MHLFQENYAECMCGCVAVCAMQLSHRITFMLKVRFRMSIALFERCLARHASLGEPRLLHKRRQDKSKAGIE